MEANPDRNVRGVIGLNLPAPPQAPLSNLESIKASQSLKATSKPSTQMEGNEKWNLNQVNSLAPLHSKVGK